MGYLRGLILCVTVFCGLQIVWLDSVNASGRAKTITGPLDFSAQSFGLTPQDALEAKPPPRRILSKKPKSNLVTIEKMRKKTSIGSSLAVSPKAYGSANYAYTAARVANTSAPASTAVLDSPVSGRPFSAVGKLYFKIGTKTYVCTATLVRTGIILTAAHCVFDFGTNSSSGWYKTFTFCPAHNKSGSFGPYGCLPASNPTIITSYYNGTDICLDGAEGVACDNDIATLRVAPFSSGANKGKYAGAVVGTIPAVTDEYYSFTPDISENYYYAQVTQLGYPAAFDSGLQMQRTDAPAVPLYGYSSDGTETYYVQLPSAQTGGSSGGPWIVNFGTKPSVSSSASLGSESAMRIMGVTSWGYTTVGVNVQGASHFGYNTEFPDNTYGTYGVGNIGALLYATCTASGATNFCK